MGKHNRMWGQRSAGNRVLMLVLSLCLAILAAPTLAQAPESNTTEAYELIARLNQWRMDEGLWPLKVNETLMQMAYAQAAYLWEQDITDSTNWHTGRQGESLRQRSQFDPYNWPTYNNALQIAIGENAAYGSVNSAIDFWQNSQIHRDTTLSVGYREIGAAAIPKGSQTVYIVVFGSRPNVLTALVNPFTGDLYFSGEQYRFATGERIQQPTRLRLFDDAGRPLTGWVEWQASMPVPENAGSTVTVLFSDGTRQSLAFVDLERDEIVLPGYTPPSESEPVQVMVCPTAAPIECVESQDALPAAANDRAVVDASPGFSVFSTNTPLPLPTVTPRPTRTPTPLPTATPTLTPTPEGPEIEIVYDSRTLSVVNVSSHHVNLQGIEFVATEGTVPITQWTTFVSVPLQNFPSGSCLQSWSWNESTPLPQPGNCQDRWSVLTLNPTRLFWSQGFEVFRNGSLTATCAAGEGRCEVDLP